MGYENKYIEDIETLNPDAIILEGFSNCIIGIASSPNKAVVLAYDLDLIMKMLTDQQGTTEKDAVMQLDYLMSSLLSEPHPPVFITR